jgi:hypothetical protein
LQSQCVEAGETLEPSALAAVEEAIGELCSPATIELRATCPECGTAFAPAVDVAAVLWSELAMYAQSLLDEVDALARRYGWSEHDILALSDVRRRRYVEGIG